MSSRCILLWKWMWSLTLIFLLIILGACNMPASNLPFVATGTNTATMTFTPSLTQSPIPIPTQTHTHTHTQTATSSLSPTLTYSSTVSSTFTLTFTSTPTDTPYPTETPTITTTPTPESAMVSTEQNVNCRWGPNSVYLVAGLFRQGATAQVDGRDYAGNWLWIQMEDFSYHCWVAASAVIINGDIDSVSKLPGDPPINSSVSSPTGVSAIRDGNKVIVTWNPAPSAVDLHYLIRANICNGQYVVEWIDVTTNTAYTLQDKQDCSGTSSAKLHVVNKTGYSSPVAIPWP